MPSGSEVVPRITAVPWDDADVQRLAGAQQVELRARYDGGEEPGTPPSAADVAVVSKSRQGGACPRPRRCNGTPAVRTA